MALIKCPECGKEVSDQAKTCIHCGAPLNVKNGAITVKCRMLNGSMMKANITTSDGRTLASIRQGGVESFTITKDEQVTVSCFGFKSVTGVLKYAGSNRYEISCTPGLFVARLALNHVDNIDSE